MVSEVRAFAAFLGAQKGNFTGHTLRVTGAQRMALAGVSEDKIRLFGRWTSSAMLRYVRETLLEKGATTVAKAVEDEMGAHEAKAQAQGPPRWKQTQFQQRQARATSTDEHVSSTTAAQAPVG